MIFRKVGLLLAIGCVALTLGTGTAAAANLGAAGRTLANAEFANGQPPPTNPIPIGPGGYEYNAAEEGADGCGIISIGATPTGGGTVIYGLQVVSNVGDLVGTITITWPGDSKQFTVVAGSTDWIGDGSFGGMRAGEPIGIVVSATDLYSSGGTECIIPQPVITFRYPS